MLPVASLTATVLFEALALAVLKSVPTLSAVACEASPVNADAYTLENLREPLPSANVLSTAGRIPEESNVTECVVVPEPFVDFTLILLLLPVIF